MSKRLVLCCDGTWNTADQKCPTNVTKLVLGIADRDGQGMEQRVFYHRGVGTGPWDRIGGGAFGVGLSRNVQDTYRFVVENYEDDDELWLFGFSRGAFTARSTAGLIRNSGVLKRQFEDRIPQAYALYRDRTAHPRGVEAQLFRRSFSSEPGIRCIGVWDTVGALGIPLSGLPLVDEFNKRWQFHDTALSTRVENAFQALAIDEKRRPFEPTLWQQQADAGGQRLEQVWFAGVHSDVGGGYPDDGLADVPLRWLAARAAAAGLTLTPGWEQATHPDALGPEHTSRKGVYRLVAPCVRTLVGTDGGSASSSSVRRTRELPGYDPVNLRTYLATDPPITDVPG
jgi:uncharacterized protein (DUF2235 family)